MLSPWVNVLAHRRDLASQHPSKTDRRMTRVLTWRYAYAIHARSVAVNQTTTHSVIARRPFTRAYMVENVFRIKATNELYNVSPGNSIFSLFYTPVFSVCNQPLSHTLPTTFPTLSPQTLKTTPQTPSQPSHGDVLPPRGRPANPPKNGGFAPHYTLNSRFHHK